MIILLLFLFYFGLSGVDASTVVKYPECSLGTGIDADRNGTKDSGCPFADQSTAIAASGGTGRAVDFNSCKLSGTMVAVSDAAASGAVAVRQPAADNEFSGQWGCTISAAVGTKTVWIRAAAPTLKLTKLWLSETVMIVPQDAAINLFNGAQTPNYTWHKTTFTFTTTAPTIYGMMAGDIRGDCLYWDTNANAVPDCPTEVVPPVADYVMLETNSGVTVDGVGTDDDWVNANVISVFSVPGTGNTCTVKLLRLDAATDRIYGLITCADSNLNAVATGADNTAIFAEDGFEISFMPDTGSTRGATTIKIAANIVATPSVYTANYPSAVEDTSHNPTCTFARAITGDIDAVADDTNWTLEFVCDMPFNATAEQVGKLQIVIPNLDATFQYKIWKGDAFAANDAVQWGSVLFSATAVPAPPADTTAPNPSTVTFVSVGTDSIVIDFTCVDAGRGCATASVLYDTASGDPYAFSATVCNIVGVNPTYTVTCTVSGLTPGTTYYFLAQACDGAGNCATGTAGEEANTVTSSAVACSRWAAPSAIGAGNGLSTTNAYQIGSFWAQATAGMVLCLNDGTYTGVNSMIDPNAWVANLQGTSGSPITIRAVNDGAVKIDGQGVRQPLRLINNSWFVVEGINVCCSSANAVELVGSSRNIIRRVVAWDAGDLNTDLFIAYSNSNFNLFEDVAGFGVARKILSSAQGGNDTIYRRAWGRWEGSTNVGPKTACQLTYNNYRMTFENVLCTWDNGSMPSTYTLQNDGVVWTGSGAGTYTSGQVQDADSIFGNGSASERTNDKLLYSIAYLPSTTTRFDPSTLIDVNAGEFDGCGTGVENFTIGNTVAGIAAGSFTSKLGFNLVHCGTPDALVASNITTIGGAGNSISAAWATSNVVTGATSASVPSIYTSLGICKKSVNGVLTTDNLWPWPMNQRIIDATTSVSSSHTHKMYQTTKIVLTDVSDPHAIADVTAQIETIFGAIPASCGG